MIYTLNGIFFLEHLGPPPPQTLSIYVTPCYFISIPHLQNPVFHQHWEYFKILKTLYFTRHKSKRNKNNNIFLYFFYF